MKFLDRIKVAAARLRLIPQRDTDIYPRLRGIGMLNQRRVNFKPTPPNLRFFSRTPYARRAINAIKNPISQLQWEIVPLKGIKLNASLQKQIDIATTCFHRPNNDDSFTTLIEQVVEDFCIFGAGVIEQQLSNNEIRPLWLWPVDAQSIQIFPLWTGGANEARYLQTLGYQNISIYEGIQLRNDEIIYIRCNPSAENPYGYGPLEIAFSTISRQLGAASYAGNVATNAQPQSIIWLGDRDEPYLRTFRNYWQNEIEGQGKIPFMGGPVEPKAVELHGGTDAALYLQYQEFVIREIATAFNLSPQNLGFDSNVNRATAEVSEDRDWDAAIKPVARNIESYLTREALQHRLRFFQLQFKFIGVDREDEQATSQIYDTYYKGNVLTPNEQREKLGMPPLDNDWGNKVFADTQIALAAARGTKVIEDTDISKKPVVGKTGGDDGN